MTNDSIKVLKFDEEEGQEGKSEVYWDRITEYVCLFFPLIIMGIITMVCGKRYEDTEFVSNYLMIVMVDSIVTMAGLEKQPAFVYKGYAVSIALESILYILAALEYVNANMELERLCAYYSFVGVCTVAYYIFKRRLAVPKKKGDKPENNKQGEVV